MGGPAPAVAEVRRAVRTALAPLRPDSRAPAPQDGAAPRLVLVACSGGADSLALAAATAFEAPRLGLGAGLLTVDHGLHPGSGGQARTVAAIGYELGLDPVHVLPVRVGRDGGPEAAARAARYAALDAAADAHDAVVLLGHTLDDQAETVLLGLGRGSGPRSLAGMARRNGRYLRPFLDVRRATTAAACAALGLPVWTDPANGDPAYQRVRLRTEALPLLDDVLQGGVAEALARTAELLREDVDALDALAAAHFSRVVRRSSPDAGTTGRQLEVGAVAALPRALRTRVLRLWTASVGAEPLSAERTAALDGLLADWHGQGPVNLPGGVDVLRASGRLEAYPTSSRTSRRE